MIAEKPTQPNRRLTIEQAKQITIEDLLTMLGHQPTRQTNNRLWYRSPFRTEKTPSFNVNQTKNVWYDFGEGKGGDIISFVKHLHSLNNVTDALETVERLLRSEPRIAGGIPSNKRQHAPISRLELVDVGPIREHALITYLQERGIEPNIAGKFIGQVHYHRGIRDHLALGIPNVRGGIELRNQTFKGTLGNKAISIIDGDHRRVWLFEGLFDFLTAATLSFGHLDGTAIILNGIALKDRAVSAIHKLNPCVVDVFPHHDPAGRQLLTTIEAEFPNIRIVNHSPLYADHGHNDLNDWHRATNTNGSSCDHVDDAGKSEHFERHCE